MHTVPFLRALFPLAGPDDPRAGDFVRVTAVKDGEWPGPVHFLTRAQLHALEDEDAYALGFDPAGLDVYFTPHGFARRAVDAAKGDAVALGDCLWVECDDDLPAARFSPRPTFAVATSPGRHHFYWLLRDPLELAEVERLNKRLAYGHRLVRDRGGWNIGRWLRVPGTHNHKRAETFAVAVEEEPPRLDADGLPLPAVLRTYAPEDFDDLPQVAFGAGPEVARPMPTAEEAAERGATAARHPLSTRLRDLLERPRKDRSKALWEIYHEGYRLGIPEEDLFALARGTPNDKFTLDYRFHGAEDLWQDILRGYRMAHEPAETPILTKLRDLRAQKMPDTDRNRLVAEAIVRDLCERGRLYVDEVTREVMYFDGVDVVLFDPERRSAWNVLLNEHYRVVQGEKHFVAVQANIHAIATKEGERIVLHTFAHWDRAAKLLYVYNNNGKAYRLDGETVETVDNGTDGILFRTDRRNEVFHPRPPQAGDPTLEGSILGLPNYAEDLEHHTRRQALVLARLWLYALFFGEQLDDLPILVVVGPTDSGKTSMLRALAILFHGADAQVTSAPDDVKTFETTVSNRHHVFFDNVDTDVGHGWFKDAVCKVATGIEIGRRVLFTTNQEVSFPVKCYVGLTCRRTWFARTDVATRLVPLHVARRELKLSSTAIYDAVRDARDALWGELLGDLNRIVAGMRGHREHTQGLRLAAFANFAETVFAALDLDGAGALAVLHRLQSNSALTESVVWSCLEPWLGYTNQVGDRPNDDRPVSVAVLYKELRQAADNGGFVKDYDRDIRTPRGLGTQLKELLPDLEKHVGVAFDARRGEYRFKLPPKEEIA